MKAQKKVGFPEEPFHGFVYSQPRNDKKGLLSELVFCFKQLPCKKEKSFTDVASFISGVLKIVGMGGKHHQITGDLSYSLGFSREESSRGGLPLATSSSLLLWSPTYM